MPRTPKATADAQQADTSTTENAAPQEETVQGSAPETSAESSIQEPGSNLETDLTDLDLPGPGTEVELPDLPVKDLTRLVQPSFQTNRCVRTRCHAEVRNLELLKHQSAGFITLPESFVLEGLDIVPIKPLGKEVTIQVELEDGRILEAFRIKGESMERFSAGSDFELNDVVHLKYGKIILRNMGDDIDHTYTGRLAFVFKGYLLEHWT